MIKTRIFIIGIFWCYSYFLNAQTKLLKIETTINAQKALSLEATKENFGIKGNIGGVAEVRMYYAKQYTNGGRSDKSLIYGAFADKNSGSYQAEAFSTGKVSWFCSIDLINPIGCAESSSSSKSYKSHIHYMILDKVIEKNVDLNDFYGAPVTNAINVIIEVEVSSGANFSDIIDIKLPGIDPFWGRSGGIPSRHPCAKSNSAACKAIKGLFKPQKATGDVFITNHRGFWGNESESSIGSVKKAYDLKWVFLEIDILRSKDGALLLMHDQQINRLTSIGLSNPTKEYVGSNDKVGNKTWVGQLNYYKKTKNVPKASGGNMTVPPLKDLRMVNKYGKAIKNRGDADFEFMRSAGEFFDYLKRWDAVVVLDIKEKDQNDYLKTTADLIELGKKKGVLSKLMFKPGSGIAGMRYEQFSNYLDKKGLLDDFNNKVAISLIVQPEQFNDRNGEQFLDFMTPWLAVPSLAVVETIYKKEGDYLLTSKSALNGKSPVDFLKDLGLRTGVFWDNATDCRGVTNGRGGWFSPDANNFKDSRGSLEWLVNKRPGMIVADRPEETETFLRLFNLYSNLNKR